jgi:flagellin-like hook-associated protein FlgL
MSISPLNLGRISTQLRGNMISRSVGQQQRLLSDVQQELTTGKRLSSPSKDAAAAAVSMQIRRLLERREAWESNLRASSTQLGQVDSSLEGLETLLRDALTTSSQNVGSDVTAAQRESAAAVIDSIFSQVLSVGNKSLNGVYLFAGDRSTAPPFEESAGGVRWVGSERLLSNEVDEAATLNFMASGSEIFGATSTRVVGQKDLTPSVAASTRLIDLRGAGATGIRNGIIEISNGVDSAKVDLTNASTLGDVVLQMNNAGISGLTFSVDAPNGGLRVDVAPGSNVTIEDVGAGRMAADLGIRTLVGPGDGVDVVGTSVSPRVTPLTPLSQLNGGAGIDTSGFVIRNGTTQATIDLSTATTVEDLLNAINTSGTFVEARVNAAGTGIDLVNAVQGIEMRLSENGGSTLSELGLRSFDTTTRLADLNNGAGLKLVEGAELRVTDSNGVGFDVEFQGLETVQDLLTAINSASTAAGAGVTASLNANANGIVLTDSAGGAGELAVANLNFSTAVSDLGLSGGSSGGVLSGTDVSPVKSKGIFSSLDALRRAMRANDQQGMTRASEELELHLERVTRVRGTVGARVREFEERSERLKDQNVATKALLSELEDTDYTEAIVRFQTLQTSLQASMQSASTMLNLSLMDFLR